MTSYLTSGSQVDLVSLVSVSCMHKPTPQFPVGPRDQKHWTSIIQAIAQLVVSLIPISEVRGSSLTLSTTQISLILNVYVSLGWAVSN